jgi:CBS domain-containing protein
VQLKDVMTRNVEVIGPDATLEDAASRMGALDIGRGLLVTHPAAHDRGGSWSEIVRRAPPETRRDTRHLSPGA